MAKEKSKEYYLVDLENKLVITDLDYLTILELLNQNYSFALADFLIFEYGLIEHRSATFKLDPKYSVNHNFYYDMDKKEWQIES